MLKSPIVCIPLPRKLCLQLATQLWQPRSNSLIVWSHHSFSQNNMHYICLIPKVVQNQKYCQYYMKECSILGDRCVTILVLRSGNEMADRLLLWLTYVYFSYILYFELFSCALIKAIFLHQIKVFACKMKQMTITLINNQQNMKIIKCFHHLIWDIPLKFLEPRLDQGTANFHTQKEIFIK